MNDVKKVAQSEDGCVRQGPADWSSSDISDMPHTFQARWSASKAKEYVVEKLNMNELEKKKREMEREKTAARVSRV
jgi:hypothetical protein